MLRPPSSASRGMDGMVIALRTNRRVLLGQARGVGLARKKRRSGSRARGNAKKRNLNGEALWLVKRGIQDLCIQRVSSGTRGRLCASLTSLTGGTHSK